MGTLARALDHDERCHVPELLAAKGTKRRGFLSIARSVGRAREHPHRAVRPSPHRRRPPRRSLARSAGFGKRRSSPRWTASRRSALTSISCWSLSRASIWIRRADGPGDATRLFTSDRRQTLLMPLTWTPDGAAVTVFALDNSKSSGDVLMLMRPTGGEAGRAAIERTVARQPSSPPTPPRRSVGPSCTGALPRRSLTHPPPP